MNATRNFWISNCGELAIAPRGDGGALALALVAAFLGGSFFGGILFAHKGKQTQITSHDVPTALSLLNSSEPTLR